MFSSRSFFIKSGGILFIIMVSFTVHAQDRADTCYQKELGDLIRSALNKPPKDTAKSSGSLILLPIIGSNPATGFMIGIGGQYAFKGGGSETLYSLLSGSVQATTKKQALFILKNNIYTKDNRIFLTGDWRFLIFSQSTYGLGTNSPEGGALDYQFSLEGAETNSDSLVQPMKFNFARLYQTVSFKLKNGLYAGVGYNLDYYFKIKDEKLRLDPDDSLITSHYAYSQRYGFNPERYYSSALNLNVILDTRDNMINPYRGYYAVLSWRGAWKQFGNKVTGNFVNIEWRSFHPLSRKNPRHLLAFWALGSFSPEGEFPYLILPATGYDQRSRAGRGYTQGRFRGNNYFYGETEYRFPISQCSGILGGVLFANISTATNPNQSLTLFESVKPGYGMGLRIMVDKKSRTNLVVDFGFGDKSSGFYLAASETF